MSAGLEYSVVIPTNSALGSLGCCPRYAAGLEIIVVND